MRLFFLLLSLLLSSGLAVSYTVQVAALTDEQAARRLLGELREQGFPAYSVGLPTPSGQVYRLRVGVFANRAAAVRYAERMAEVTPFMPAPALAEDMPRDFVALEPNLLRAFPYAPGATRAEILHWPEDTTVLRVQGAQGITLEAEYYLLEEEASVSLRAWQLSEPEDGWVERVANFPLWPATYWDMDEITLREEKEARLAAVAQTLSLSPAALEGFVMHLPENDMPVLVLADRFHLRSRESRRYLAVGNPVAWQGEPEGPPLVWLEGAPPAGFPSALPAPAIDLSSLLTSEVSGEALEDVAAEEDAGDGGTFGNATDAQGDLPEEAAEETVEGPAEAPEEDAAEDAEEDAGEDLGDDAPGGQPEEEADETAADTPGSPNALEPGEAPDDDAGEAAEGAEREDSEREDAAGPEVASEESAQAQVGEGAGGEEAELTSSAWTAHADGGFTRLVVQEGERLRSWRALVGEPVWLQGNYLLAYSEGELLLYLLRPPP